MNVKEEVNVASVAPAVRIPVQLTPAVRRGLAQWCRETAGLLDVPGVTRDEVIEALVDQLVEDPYTSDAVRGRLAELTTYRRRTPVGGVPPRALSGVRTGQTLIFRTGHRPERLCPASATLVDHYLCAVERPATAAAGTEGSR